MRTDKRRVGWQTILARGTWVLGLGLVAGAASAAPPPNRTLVPFGLPSREHVVERPRYVLAYDAARRGPAWVSARRRPEPPLELGESREGIDDPDVLRSARAADFAGLLPATGFAPQRLLPWSLLAASPAADAPPAEADTVRTHARYVTLTAPMHKDGMNGPAGLWQLWERWWADSAMHYGDDQWVIAGPIYGREPLDRLGPERDIWVPSAFFVIVVATMEGIDEPEVLALLLPHQTSPRGTLRGCVTTVHTLESLTGLNFFPDLDDDRERWLERRDAERSWHGPPPPDTAHRGFRAALIPELPMESVAPPRIPQAVPSYSRIEDARPAPLDRPPLLPRAAPPAADPVGGSAPPTSRPRDGGDFFRPALPESVPAAPESAPKMDAPAAPSTTAEKDRLVRVFYGTNREVDDETVPNDFYGDQPGLLALGTCEVSLPPNRAPGELPRPLFDFLPEDPAEHVVLQAVRPLDRDAFLEQLRDRVSQADGRQAFVFVHGYNNSFADAARRTAQMAYDLRLNVAPVMYSWPSRSRFEKYFYDQREIVAARPHLLEFLRLVTTQTGAERVHLIAHSMGSDLVKDVLKELAESGPLPTLHEIILAAPDIEAETFLRDIAPKIEKTGRRLTIYSSRRDKALVSSLVANGKVRLGYAPVPELQRYRWIDQVDASHVDTSIIGHAYYGDDAGVIRDLALVLQGRPATEAERKLKRRRDHYFLVPAGLLEESTAFLGDTRLWPVWLLLPLLLVSVYFNFRRRR